MLTMELICSSMRMAFSPWSLTCSPWSIASLPWSLAMLTLESCMLTPGVRRPSHSPAQTRTHFHNSKTANQAYSDLEPVSLSIALRIQVRHQIKLNYTSTSLFSRHCKQTSRHIQVIWLLMAAICEVES
jgi:hypothetical protein